MKVMRVLVVDDSVFMRKIVSDLIAELPGYEVVGTAKNGREAIVLNQSLSPDCITMDVEMPEMNGLEALKVIMKEKPTPVIMLSSLTQEGALETIQALELGAIDFLGKPSGSISLDLYKVKGILHEKLEIASKSKVRSSSRPFQQTSAAPTLTKQPTAANLGTKAKGAIAPSGQTAANPRSTTFEHLVAIGTSTGGPRALQQVLSRIPGDFPAPILIVQHMPPNFTQSLAMRLDANSAIRVVEGEEGMILQTGTAYVAPGGYHMTIRKDAGKPYQIRLNSEPPRGGHRPSVDTMYDSILGFQELKKHIVLMTGMGSDGAKGMLELKRTGAITTIAESEETCIVYGMPRAAVELKCVDHVLPVHEIPNKLVQIIMK